MSWNPGVEIEGLTFFRRGACRMLEGDPDLEESGFVGGGGCGGAEGGDVARHPAVDFADALLVIGFGDFTEGLAVIRESQRPDFSCRRKWLPGGNPGEMRRTAAADGLDFRDATLPRPASAMVPKVSGIATASTPTAMTASIKVAPRRTAMGEVGDFIRRCGKRVR
jgi:hypothetical protein